MYPSKTFTRFPSICCFASVITTLGIHLWFADPPSDFEQRIIMFRDKIYLLNRWWVIAHCLLVIFSMWGMALLLLKKSPGFAPLGFLFFAVFGLAEITRQMYVLFYINGLREQYSLATDPSVKEILKNTLTHAGILSSPLFGLFVLTFGIGNLFYGFSLSGEKGFGKLLSLLLIAWAIGNFAALGNEFWRSPSLSNFLEHYSYTYQPFMRLLLAIWLWNKSSSLQN